MFSPEPQSQLGRGGDKDPNMGQESEFVYLFSLFLAKYGVPLIPGKPFSPSACERLSPCSIYFERTSSANSGCVFWRMFSFPQDNSQALIHAALSVHNSSQLQMTEKRFRAFIKLQTAPALTPHKTLRGSQPGVDLSHPPLSAGGSVPRLTYPPTPHHSNPLALKLKAVARKGVWAKQNRGRQIDMRSDRAKCGVRDRLVDPHDVGEDVWIIPSNKSH